MLGSDEPYTEIPYFWSDLADWCSLEYVGPAQDPEWDRDPTADQPGRSDTSPDR